MNGRNRLKASRDFMRWFGRLTGDQTVSTPSRSEAGAAGVSMLEFDRYGKAARRTRELMDMVHETARSSAE